MLKILKKTVKNPKNRKLLKILQKTVKNPKENC